MPVKTGQFTLSETVRQKIVDASTQPQFVQIHNATKSSNEYIFIGNDTVTTTVGMVLFWPSLFFLGGTKEQESQYAQLRGEYQALEQVSIQKKCMLSSEKK